MTISRYYVTPPLFNATSNPTFHSTASFLLCKAAETGYEQLIASIAEDFKVDCKSITLCYMITTDFPTIVDFCIEPKVDLEGEMNTTGITIDSSEELFEETLLPLRSVKPLVGKNLSIE